MFRNRHPKLVRYQFIRAIKYIDLAILQKLKIYRNKYPKVFENELFEFCVGFRSSLLNSEKLAKQRDDFVVVGAILINVHAF